MTNQTPEKSGGKPAALSMAGQLGHGANGGDHQVQVLLLKRQIAELERRLESVVASERRTRTDLIASLAEKQASTQEQARLQEELAARERLANEIFLREAGLQSDVTALRTKLRQLETELSYH